MKMRDPHPNGRGNAHRERAMALPRPLLKLSDTDMTVPWELLV